MTEEGCWSGAGTTHARQVMTIADFEHTSGGLAVAACQSENRCRGSSAGHPGVCSVPMQYVS